MKAFFNRFLLCAMFAALMVMISACGDSARAMKVVVFSAGDFSNNASQRTPRQNTPEPLAPESTPQPSVSENVRQPDLALAAEQNAGYQYAETENTPTAQASILTIAYQMENNPDKEIAATVRDLVEGKGLGDQPPVIALLGATANESSMRLASLSNAFSVPMIIPSSVGDNLLPANNLWVFRLSAPGSAHAQYFFNDVLNRSVIVSFNGQTTSDGELTATPSKTPTPLPSGSPSPTPSSSLSLLPAAELSNQLPFNVAILYEQGTFGESAAVAAANQAMKQGMTIRFYGNFDSENFDYKGLKVQVEEIRTQRVHLIYIISSQPKIAQIVVKTIRDGISKPEEMPVLLGQSGAFSSREFLGYPEAEGMFVLRQKIVADCPQEIKSLAEAQSYAAIGLLRLAMEKTRSGFGNSFASQSLVQRREAVRDTLKIINEDLKCLGRVSFDNTGQNKNLQFEILKITSMGPDVITEKDFRIILQAVYNRAGDSSSPFDLTP